MILHNALGHELANTSSRSFRRSLTNLLFVGSSDYGLRARSTENRAVPARAITFLSRRRTSDVRSLHNFGVQT